MVRTILVGLDGSDFSRSAVELGIRWAGRFDALLVGLGVIDEPGIRRSEPVPLGGDAFKEHRDEVVLARARRHVEQILERFSLRCAEAGVAYKVLENTGTPYEQVLVEAQRYDLILLGQETHFHFPFQDDPCETLHKVLRATPRPVMRVPLKLPSATSVVVAYDGSLQAARALQAFQLLGLDGTEEVHVVTVGREQAQAVRHADRAVEFLGFHGIQARRHVLQSTAPPAEAILDQVRQLGGGLLVMGAYGQPMIREFFLGSVTRTILEKTDVPLVLYH